MTNSSRSASEIVRDVIERDAVIRNGLARGLINVRALARYMQVTTREDTTFEALVAAIRRYPIKETAAKRKGMGKLILRLGMKNKVVEATIRNDPEIPALLGKFSQEIDFARGETLSVVTGAENTRVLIDAKNLDKLARTIPKKNIIGVLPNQAAVILTYTEAGIKSTGFIAALSNEIAMDGINISDFVHSFPDALFVVDEKDSVKAYQALERLSNEG